MNNIKHLCALFLILTLLSACGSSSGSNTSANNNSGNTPGDNTNNGGSKVTESLFPNYNTSAIAADNKGMESNAQQLANQISLGWNIGNTMEATGGETAWGNPMISDELIQLVKDSGFNAIRLPVAWDQYADQDTAEIDTAWLDRVKQVVQYIVDKDMYVLVNIHWDGGWLENNINPTSQELVNARQKAYWQQIATHLREFDERLLFASANEPHVEKAEQMNVLMSYHQTFVDAVRETGGKNAYRVLVVQGPKTDIELTQQLWQEMPVDTIDSRLMMEVHYYTPYQFALMEEDQNWGDQFFYWGEDFHSLDDSTRNATWGEEEAVLEFFGWMKQKFVDQGIPIVLGEYSAIRRIGQLQGDALELHLQSRAYYHKYVTEQAIAHGMLPFYWDNGGTGHLASGLFDRANLTVFDQQTIDALQSGLQTAQQSSTQTTM